jgi:hypothetical protein
MSSSVRSRTTAPSGGSPPLGVSTPASLVSVASCRMESHALCDRGHHRVEARCSKSSMVRSRPSVHVTANLFPERSDGDSQTGTCRPVAATQKLTGPSHSDVLAILMLRLARKMRPIKRVPHL